MSTPFDNLPLNTKQSYTMGTAKGGCEIYIPVDSRELSVIHSVRDRLKAWLLTQPDPPVVAPEEPPPKRYA
jgi:hypothetical protein